MAIEESLKKKGWTVSKEIPLILGENLASHIEATKEGRDGKLKQILSLCLYHKGDSYVLSWTRWDQSEAGKDTGHHSDGATHFDPDIEAAAAGFSDAVTVDTTDSVIRFWKKP